MSESEMKPNWAGHQHKPAPCWQNDWYHKHSMQTYWDIWKFNEVLMRLNLYHTGI